MPERKDVPLFAILVIAAFGGGVAVGYLKAPTKVKVEERVVEKVVKDTAKKQDKNLVRVRETRPDGTTVTRTEVNTKTETNSKTSTDRDSEKTTVIDNRGPVRVGLLAGRRFDDILGETTFGLSVSKRVLGPFTLGAWGLSNKTIGLSVGVEL